MAAEKECVYVLFERHMCKFDVIDDKPANELEIVVDFESESLPMFMAPFVLNSKLYMIGGLHLQRITSDLGYFEKLVIAQSSAGDDGLNRSVYLLDPTGPQMSKYCRADIPSPQAPKPGPKVFVIDSKVYLLGSFDYHYCQKLPYPAFECFDPQDNSWTTLPEPPFYRDKYKWDEVSRILNSCAFGRNIFVSNDIFSAGGLQYNVDECEWKYRDWLPYCTMSPTHGVCCVEQTDKNGLAAVFTRNGPLVFHLAPDGTPMRWQYLSNLYSLTGFPTLPDMEYRINGHVCHIRDEKYCLLISRYYGRSHILYVAIFQLKVKKTHAQGGEKYDLVKAGEQDFTDSDLLYTRQYDIQFADNPTITVALAMLQDHTELSQLDLKLDNLQLAAKLSGRGNLPGTDNMVVRHFKELFDQTKYKEAAEIAAKFPRILRTPDTLAKIQRVPGQEGKSPPLLLYFVALMDREKLNAFESLEFSRLVVNQNNKHSVKDMLAKGKLECSEELGDLVKTFDKDLALIIYCKARTSPKVIGAFAERRKFDKLLVYSKAVGYTPDDYLYLLRTVFHVNPKGAVTFAIKMSQLEGGCPVDYSTIADLFIQGNLIPEATAFLLHVLKPNLPEHAPLQTKVLAINLANSPDVAFEILTRGMFSHYDRREIDLLCQRAGLNVQSL